MFRELETFRAICHHGTFTAAGGQLGLTQSAVSDQMKRLEDYLGRRLFYRTGRSATLNAAGRDLLPLAEQVLHLMATMRGGAAASPLAGTIHVGTIASMHNGLAARALLAFRAAFPAAAIRLARGDRDDLLLQVQRERLDLAIVLSLPMALPKGVMWLPLLRKPFVLLAPISLPAGHWREALPLLPLLRYDRTTTSGSQIDEFLARTAAVLGDTILMNNFDTMISLVARGMGVALVPASELGEAESLVRVFDLGNDVFYREIGVLRRRDDETPLTDGFLVALRDEAIREPFSELPDLQQSWRKLP